MTCFLAGVARSEGVGWRDVTPGRVGTSLDGIGGRRAPRGSESRARDRCRTGRSTAPEKLSIAGWDAVPSQVGVSSAPRHLPKPHHPIHHPHLIRPLALSGQQPRRRHHHRGHPDP